MSGQPKPQVAQQIINNLNAQLIKIPDTNLTQIKEDLFPDVQRLFGNVTFNPNNLALDNYPDNVKLKRIVNDVNTLIFNPREQITTNIQNIINIIVNLQKNLVTINGYNNTNISQNIKDKYIKYIQYLQKIIIVKLWKDMKILELFLLMFKKDGIVDTLLKNLNYFHTRIENVQIDTTLGNSNFNTETKSESDLIGGVTEAYNVCLKEIRDILGQFVKSGLGGQQGGAINVNIINNATDDAINNHITNLITYKNDFESALQNNINTFSELCFIFKEILNKILGRITTYTNSKVVRKYINIVGLEDTLKKLNNDNSFLMDKLKNYSTEKLNSPTIVPPAQPPPTTSGGTRKKKSKPKSKSKSKSGPKSKSNK